MTISLENGYTSLIFALQELENSYTSVNVMLRASENNQVKVFHPDFSLEARKVHLLKSQNNPQQNFLRQRKRPGSKK